MVDMAAFVGFHDAELERIVVSVAHGIEIEFSHLLVYQPEAAGVYGVWSYRAAVVVCGAWDLDCGGAWAAREAPAGLVEDGHVLDEQGHRIDALSGLEAGVKGKVELWLSGRTSPVTINADTIALRLGKRGDRLESWRVPSSVES